MGADIVIRVQNIVKTYRLYNNRVDRVKETFHPFRKKYHHPFNALNGISFDVKKGECIGIIGRNGGGKSTLLQIICGILQPSSGSIEVNGKIAAILELGAGFNPEYTGRQNVYLNASILGLTNEEIDAKFDDIISFADIGEFIDQPTKIYSSGMIMRLAFAVAVNVHAEILIIDEALSVGDTKFQKKCFDKIQSFKKEGRTILFVSHDTGSIVSICNRAILINGGIIYDQGEPSYIAKVYHRLLFDQDYGENKSLQEDNNSGSESMTQEREEDQKENATAAGDDNESNHSVSTNSISSGNDKELRYGDRKIEIFKAGIRNDKGVSTTVVNFAESCQLFFQARFVEDINEKIAFGFIISNAKGLEIFGTKGGFYDVWIPPGKCGQVVECTAKINMMLVP
ncbi:MAG: ABC transporter ATP-binding protein, partial [Desulfobacterales bacterium]